MDNSKSLAIIDKSTRFSFLLDVAMICMKSSSWVSYERRVQKAWSMSASRLFFLQWSRMLLFCHKMLQLFADNASDWPKFFFFFWFDHFLKVSFGILFWTTLYYFYYRCDGTLNNRSDSTIKHLFLFLVCPQFPYEHTKIIALL